MTKSNGFSLIELMVVVGIIAILASIAMPSYNNYTFRARRADGKHVLQNLAMAQERFFSTYNRYSGTLANLGFASNSSPEGYYTLSIALDADSLGYTATATATGAQATDKCGNLTLTNAGVKGKSGNESNGSCW